MFRISGRQQPGCRLAAAMKAKVHVIGSDAGAAYKPSGIKKKEGG
jgi:hypothetical protein